MHANVFKQQCFLDPSSWGADAMWADAIAHEHAFEFPWLPSKGFSDETHAALAARYFAGPFVNGPAFCDVWRRTLPAWVDHLTRVHMISGDAWGCAVR